MSVLSRILQYLTALPYLRWLAHLLADDLPPIIFVVLDRLQQRCALSCCQYNNSFSMDRGEANEIADLVFSEFSVMHVLQSK